MQRFLIFWVLIGTSIAVIAGNGVLKQPVPAPEFTHTVSTEWIGSPPLKLKDFRGNVLLIDFWTFDCWNCYRSFPWLNNMETRFAPKGLKVLGVHTPEFAHEKVRQNIEEKIVQFKLKHPVMMDNDFSYWKAMHNRYWPAYYILDKKGNIRGIFFGETHEGDRRAKEIEALIEALLLEQV